MEPPVTSSPGDQESLPVLLVEHYKEQFWSELRKVSTVLSLWAVSLVILLVSTIYPLPKKWSGRTGRMVEVEESERRVANLKREILELQEEIAAPVQQVQDQATSAPDQAERAKRDAQERQQLPRQLQEKIWDLEEATLEWRKKRDEVSRFEAETKISLPNGELPLPDPYVPVLWTALVSAIIVYFLYKRIVLFAILGRITHIYQKELSKPLSRLDGLGAWAPFWLAPLPELVGGPAAGSSQESLRGFLGWKDHRPKQRLTLALLVVALLAQAWILWLIVELDAFFGDQTLSRLSVAGALGALLCSLMASILWLRPRIPVRGFPQHLTEETRGRRTFLKALAALSGVAVLASLYPLVRMATVLPRTGTVERGRNPRFRYRTAAEKNHARGTQLDASFRGSFQQNNESKVVHYIDAQGRGASGVNLKPANLVRLGDAEAINVLTGKHSGTPETLRMNGSQVSLVSEQRVLKELARIESLPREARGGAPSNLFELLMNALQQDRELKKNRNGIITGPPNYRLLDLYAGMAHRLGKADETTKLIRFIEGDKDLIEDHVLKKRRGIWTGKAGRWSKRWKLDKLAWKPSVMPY